MQRRLFEPRNMCSEEPGKLVDVHAFLRLECQVPDLFSTKSPVVLWPSMMTSETPLERRISAPASSIILTAT